MQKYLTILSFILCLVVSTHPLRAQARDSGGLDINDVAVLFPLDSQAQALPHISLAEGQSPTLISTAVFNQLIKASRAAGIDALFPAGIDSPSDWTVVGYRIDPCAPRSHDGPGGPCTAELRLVAQPSSPAIGPADTAMHLLYDIDSIRTRVYQDALTLKTQGTSLTMTTTDGKPLGVHPLLHLSSIGASPEIATLHKNFILTYAKTSRLKKVTIMGLRDALAIDWIFLGGDVVNGNWYQGKIPNLPEGQDRLIEFDLRNAVNSFATEPLDKRLSTFDFFSVDIVPTAEVLKTLADAAHILENPELSNLNTVDCLSCHSATSMRIHPIAAMPFHIEGLSPTIPQGITAFPEPLSLQNHELHWNLRAFGYFGRNPALSIRTVAEAARSADAINKVLGKTNPGPDCRGVEAEVSTCFAKSSSQLGPQKTAKECLSLCKTTSGTFLNDFFNN